MKTITQPNGQTYVEIERDGDWVLIPAHKWIEEQVAVEEIAIAFELLYEKKNEPRFKLFIRWLLAQLQKKYGERWKRVFDAYIDSPYVGQLIAKMEIDDIINLGKGAE